MESFRKTVMKRAHEMHKETNKSFAICLIQAWKVYRLSKKMVTGAVKFAFEKKDGTLRYATGTLKHIINTVAADITKNYKAVPYYDIEVQGFRSFKIQNLITVY
jgi:hypothetical protein